MPANPDKGSEPEVGLAWARAAAVAHDVTVLTRANNLSALAPYESSSLTFVGFDLPWPFLRLKRLLGSQFYYLCWQIRAARIARDLHVRRSFDAVHHLTFASDWMPAGVLKVPSSIRIWGPVGGRAKWPAEAIKWLGYRGTLGEFRRQVITGVLRFTVGRRTASRATTSLAQNQDVLEALPSDKAALYPNVVVPDGFGRSQVPRPERHTAVAVGRLEPLKALRLAVAAIAELKRRGDHWNLILIGDGVQRSELLAQAERLGVSDRVASRARYRAATLPRPLVLPQFWCRPA